MFFLTENDAAFFVTEILQLLVALSFHTNCHLRFFVYGEDSNVIGEFQNRQSRWQ